MNKFFSLFLFLVLFSSYAFSQGTSTTEFEISNRIGFLPSVKLGANLFSSTSVDKNEIITPKNVPQFSGGFGADYFFGKYFGTFTQVDFNQRTYSFLGLIKASASFVDVPFGIALNSGKFLWIDSSRTTSRVGGYIALPMSDFEFDKNSSSIIFGTDKSLIPLVRSQTYGGLFLETESLFAVSRNLSPGLSAWTKIPLGSSSEGVKSNFYEVGLGLKVGFF